MGFLLLALLFGTGSFSDLDNVSGEWIDSASGFTKTELLDLTDYGDMFYESSDAYVFPFVCFDDLSGDDIWKAVVVYSDKIVLFREGSNPIHTSYNFPFHSVFFSTKGTFVFLYQSTEPGQSTDRAGLRINTETGEQAYFNSHWNGLPPGYIARDDGSLILCTPYDFYSSEMLFFDSNLVLQNSLEVEGISAASLSDNFFLASKSDGLARFSYSGEIEWEGGEARSQSMVISPDANFYLSPLSSGTGAGLRLGSTSTGLTILDYELPFLYTVCDKPIFLENTNKWMCSARAFPGADEPSQGLLINGDTETALVTVTVLPDYFLEYTLVDSNGPTMLMRRRHSSDHSDSSSRYMILTSDGHSLFATSRFELTEAQHQGQLNLLSDVISLNADGSRLVYTEGSFLQLVELWSD